MDLGLLTRALHHREVDLIAGNTTDGLIPVLDLYVLEDDKHYFPPYQAVPVVRQQTLDRYSGLLGALAELGGKISDQQMQKLNYEIEGKKRAVKDVVREYLAQIRK